MLHKMNKKKACGSKRRKESKQNDKYLDKKCAYILRSSPAIVLTIRNSPIIQSTNATIIRRIRQNFLLLLCAVPKIITTFAL